MNPLVVIKVNITFYGLHDFKMICKSFGDITYIKTYQGWSYLASVLDLALRQVVGLCQSILMLN
jgi:hypothetical protein